MRKLGAAAPATAETETPTARRLSRYFWRSDLVSPLAWMVIGVPWRLRHPRLNPSGNGRPAAATAIGEHRENRRRHGPPGQLPCPDTQNFTASSLALLCPALQCRPRRVHNPLAGPTVCPWSHGSSRPFRREPQAARLPRVRAHNPTCNGHCPRTRLLRPESRTGRPRACCSPSGCRCRRAGTAGCPSRPYTGPPGRGTAGWPARRARWSAWPPSLARRLPGPRRNCPCAQQLVTYLVGSRRPTTSLADTVCCVSDRWSVLEFSELAGDDAVEHLHARVELGGEVHAGARGDDQHGPQAVREFMAEQFAVVGNVPGSGAGHDELGEVTDIANEPERQFLGSPRAPALREVEPVVRLGDGQRSRRVLPEIGHGGNRRTMAGDRRSAVCSVREDLGGGADGDGAVGPERSE